MQDIGREIHAWLQARLGLQPGQAATLPKIYLHTSYLDDSTYKRLYASCDAVVLPTRLVASGSAQGPFRYPGPVCCGCTAAC